MHEIADWPGSSRQVRLGREVGNARTGVDGRGRRHPDCWHHVAAADLARVPRVTELATPLHGTREGIETVDPVGLGGDEHGPVDKEWLTVDRAVHRGREELAE